MYCLFCVVLCIVCVYMSTVLLPPGGYPIAVKYIISYIIWYDMIYHIISHRIISYLNNARVGGVWRSTCFGFPMNRYVHRKSIFLYLDMFVVVVWGRMEDQDIEMTACLFVSVCNAVQYSTVQLGTMKIANGGCKIWIEGNVCCWKVTYNVDRHTHTHHTHTPHTHTHTHTFLLRNLVVSWLAQKFTSSYESHSFITRITNTCHWPIFWVKWVQSTIS